MCSLSERDDARGSVVRRLSVGKSATRRSLSSADSDGLPAQGEDVPPSPTLRDSGDYTDEYLEYVGKQLLDRLREISNRNKLDT